MPTNDAGILTALRYNHCMDSNQKSLISEPISIRLMLGTPSACPYLTDRQAQYAVVTARDKQDLGYPLFLENGFRRDGNFIFKPMCPECNACESLKIDVDNFIYKRRHKRNLQANSDLNLSVMPISRIQEYHQIFAEYQLWRHPEQADHLDQDSLMHFQDKTIDSHLLIAKLEHKVVAVTVVDSTDLGLSAVYSIYQPKLAERGLGTFMILQLLEFAKQDQKPWVYLGYYVEDCKKLSYKKSFTPLKTYNNTMARWEDFE